MAALLAKLCHEPEVLKRVGRQAQEEIYISWDDAVHRAQRRYEIVIEQYRSCGSAHRRFSDEYYQSLGMCIDVLKRSRETPARTMGRFRGAFPVKLKNLCRPRGQQRFFYRSVFKYVSYSLTVPSALKTGSLLR